MSDYYDSESDNESEEIKSNTSSNHLQVIPYKPPPDTSVIEYILIGVVGALSLLYKFYR